jgi:hypothetical protein
MAQTRLVREQPSISEQRWQERVEAWRQSGQTQTEYCSVQGIALSSLSRWHRELPRRAHLRGQSLEAVAETPSPETAGETLRWIPVGCREGLLAELEASAQREPAGRFELVSPRGWVIRLDRHFDGPSLRRLLGVLEEVSC